MKLFGAMCSILSAALLVGCSAGSTSTNIGRIAPGSVIVATTGAPASLDFTTTSEAVEAGLPERESWRLAFGLTASLVWLYVEILRVLMYLASIFSND